MLLPFVTGFVEYLVGFAGRQSFIPEMNRQPRQLAKGTGEYQCFFGSVAAFARKAQWIADHNPHHRKTPRQPRQRPHVLARIPSPCEGEHRLSGQAQLVRHRHADALCTKVEAEKP